MVSVLQNSPSHGQSSLESLSVKGCFDVRHRDAYLRWRDNKQNAIAKAPELTLIEISNPYRLSRSEKAAIKACCQRHNSCLYELLTQPRDDPRDAVVALGQALGLQRLDQSLAGARHPVATISVTQKAPFRDYIPYTNQPINWHTDGYYNEAARQIHGVIMHCAQPAETGGTNSLLDPELVYIKVRDTDPGMIEALMASDALCIPANVRNGKEVRPARCGPVFSLNPRSGKLHMRYTARTTSAQWRTAEKFDISTQLGTAIFDLAKDRALTVRLTRNQGIICNNVLHTRDGFDTPAQPAPAPARTVLRARFYDRVFGT